jgi:hypothetical protein
MNKRLCAVVGIIRSTDSEGRLHGECVIVSILDQSSRHTKRLILLGFFFMLYLKEARLSTQCNTEDDLIVKHHRCANLKSHINYLKERNIL